MRFQKNFAGNTGAATTTWNYHTQRGWLSNKRYPSPATGFVSTTGTDYDYWPSGRLKKRTWARGNPRLDTTYAYNDAGDLATVTYSDGTTPNVTHTYDRLGRQQTVARDGMTTTLSHNLAGQPF